MFCHMGCFGFCNVGWREEQMVFLACCVQDLGVKAKIGRVHEILHENTFCINV